MSCSSEATESDRHVHEHGHDGHVCDGHCEHGHDHGEHEKPDEWEEPSLFAYIDLEQCRLLNAQQESADVVLKHPSRLTDRSTWVESDVDEELIVHVQFASAVCVRKICLLGGEEDSCPREMHVWINREDIDFDNARDVPFTQRMEVPNDHRHLIDYKTKYVHFQNVHSLTLFFPSNYGAETTKIYALGFKGDATEYKRHIGLDVDIGTMR
eukprot:EC687490.1.p1 GENE.EC687490.1~~EC687490.1.p1  ORF type:complete len:211 (+),score=99.04 EC687490.1:28-660(+)